MGIGLLPWLLGSLLFLGPLYLMFSGSVRRWWEYVLLPLASVFGAYGT